MIKKSFVCVTFFKRTVFAEKKPFDEKNKAADFEEGAHLANKNYFFYMCLVNFTEQKKKSESYVKKKDYNNVLCGGDSDVPSAIASQQLISLNLNALIDCVCRCAYVPQKCSRSSPELINRCFKN